MLKVIVGGTFSVIHKGHEKLLKKAFEIGEVTIGLTSDNFIKSRKKYETIPYQKREKKLKDFLKQFSSKYEIKKIENEYDIAIEKNFDVIIVSDETYGTALEINQIRKQKALKPLKIEKIDMMLAEDSKPISSERLLKKEIDESGKIIND